MFTQSSPNYLRLRSFIDGIRQTRQLSKVIHQDHQNFLIVNILDCAVVHSHEIGYGRMDVFLCYNEGGCSGRCVAGRNIQRQELLHDADELDMYAIWRQNSCSVFVVDAVELA